MRMTLTRIDCERTGNRGVLQSYAFVFGMARNSGQRNGARARLLGNMAAKHSKEMYGRNKTK